MNDTLAAKIASLPDSPGCYLMKEQGQIIYVGKAINLKNRVRSYFRSTGHTPKVAALVSHIDDFDIMLTSTNLEALMLECNLIKEHRPYYNILLKDDKHYPYLRIDPREPFPRLSIVRRTARDGALYFGPYIGTTALNQVFSLLKQIFPLRTCRMKLPLKAPVRPCVNYEMGRCPAPCANRCGEAEYASIVRDVLGFLRGQYKPVIAMLTEQMKQAARTMQYEKAAELRNTVADVRSLMEQQNATDTDSTNRDVIAVCPDALDAMAQVMYIRGGRMIGGDSYFLKGEGGEETGELLSSFIAQFYLDRTPPREVIAEAVSDEDTMRSFLRERGAAAFTIPVRGDKKALIELAKKNAKDALIKQSRKKQVIYERTEGAMRELARVLNLQNVPRRIEGFDISNTQGDQSVASMVVFMDGVPAKKEYRHFRIRTVKGANDFASMNEVLRRRFLRILDPVESRRWPAPDLLLVDGGPEQLRFALDAMRELNLRIPMFGLAKRLEEIWLPDTDEPILLPRDAPALHLIQHVRDESHRFAITHHRLLRGKHSLHSRLEDIPGIGPARRRALLSHFRTIKAIGEADMDALSQVPGLSLPAAMAVYKAFHPDETDCKKQPPSSVVYPNRNEGGIR